MGCPGTISGFASDDDSGPADDDDAGVPADDDATDDDDATADDDDATDDDDDTGAAEAAAELVGGLDLDDYSETIQTLASFGDRSVGSASYVAAEDRAVAEFEAMGYEVQRHGFSYGGQSIDNLYVTKVGTVHPDRMYILGAHLDGRGGGGAADDDGSGVALVLEAARAFAADGVEVEISIRFVLWNAEEVGLVGSEAYVADRAPLQGIEDPVGSGQFPEPTWLGMIQQDMILFDHGLPVADEQSPHADVDVEFQASATLSSEGQALAQRLAEGCGDHCSDYPAGVGDNMSNTDSYPFRNHCAAVSVRENERIAEIGAGTNPHWHQPTDVWETYSEDDFRLGLNATQMVVGTVAELAGASVGN